MSRRFVFLNLGSSVWTQIASIVAALVLPPLIISTYGSAINGLVSSVNQFVRYFSLVEGGVIAAAGVNLFLPLSRGDAGRINAVYSAVNRFFRHTGHAFIVVSAVFAMAYPYSLSRTGDYAVGVIVAATACIVPVLGYYIYFKYNLILGADQKSYVVVNSIAVSNLAAVALQVFAIRLGANIYVAVGIATLVAVLRMNAIRGYVLRHYSFLDSRAVPDMSALVDKWIALATNMSRMLKMLVPVATASFMFGFEYTSIFTVYALVFSVGSSILGTASNALTATTARLRARSEERLSRVYSSGFLVVSMLIVVLSSCFLALLMPFLQLYVGRLADQNYLVPLLAATFVANEAFNNFRLMPEMMIRAAGRYRETLPSAAGELVISLLLTPTFAYFLGFPGILIGSVIASFFRTVLVSVYVHRYLIPADAIASTLRCYFCTLMMVLLLAFSFYGRVPDAETWMQWILTALIVSAISTGATILSFAVICRREFFYLVRLLGIVRG